MIPTLQTITPMQAWERMTEYFATAERLAVNEYGDCVYRTEDGRKCAVGCLITDDEYDPVIEFQTVDVILDDAPALQFMFWAQGMHDTFAMRDGLSDSERVELFREWLRNNKPKGEA